MATFQNVSNISLDEKEYINDGLNQHLTVLSNGTASNATESVCKNNLLGMDGDDSDSIATDFGPFNDSCLPLIASEDVAQLIDAIDVSSFDKDLNVDNGTRDNSPVKYTTIKPRILDNQSTANDCMDETLEMNESSTNVDESGIFYDTTNQSVGTSPTKSCHESCISNDSSPKSGKLSIVGIQELPILMEPDQNLVKKAARKSGIPHVQDINKSPTEDQNNVAELPSNKRKHEDLDLTPRRKSQRLQNMSTDKNLESNLKCTKQHAPSFEGETNILKSQQNNQSDLAISNGEVNDQLELPLEECCDSLPLKTAVQVKSQINHPEPSSDIRDTDNVQQINSEIRTDGDETASNNNGNVINLNNTEDSSKSANGSKPLKVTTGGYFHRAKDACAIM